MIALAVALSEHGLNIRFYSDNDSEPNLIEVESYKIANQIGVEISNSISINKLISQMTPHSIPIVLYNTDENNGHITPLIGVEKELLYLPYSDDGKMFKKEFIKRWDEEGILKQCIVAEHIS